jgi:hypothetical protein
MPFIFFAGAHEIPHMTGNRRIMAIKTLTLFFPTILGCSSMVLLKDSSTSYESTRIMKGLGCG